MKKVFKVLLILGALFAVTMAALAAAFAVVTKDAKLDAGKLTDYSRSITVCDKNGNEITNASLSARRRSVQTEKLDPLTVKAFIASEDRKFYSHHGLNYGRMLKALGKNILSRSFSQGASTISQQLIKNTHLSGDKTIDRKLKEIKLTKQLERRYSKDQILEMYLNTIYFGHNCYGLESAAEYYFATTADRLDLSQSAALAGLLTSPNNYSPYRNPDKCTKRRNIVLKSMLECGFIDEKTYASTCNKPIETSQQRQSDGTGLYLNAVFDELEDLGLDFYGLPFGGKVITYLDGNLQNELDAYLSEDSYFAAIITGKDGGIKAYRSDTGGAERQPGSTIKPLLVYAPAIEEKLIRPATKILDEKVNYSGYSPENYDKKYHGYVSAEEALAKSYNIPAVKTLNTLTLGKAEKYAGRMGIDLDKDECNLSLALGGMKHGLTLEALCEKYRAFANGGSYTSTAFIKEVRLGGGEIVYRHRPQKIPVFSRGTASLMNGMLQKSVSEGTAKKIGVRDYSVAAKTGTCGNKSGNTDAYCIAYTSTDCIGVWLGSDDSTPVPVNGGMCCNIVKGMLDKLYLADRPPALDCTSGTAPIEIDAEEYNKNNRIILADEASPKLNKKVIRVLENDIPTEVSTRFSQPVIQKPTIERQNNDILIKLCQTKYYAYIIKRRNNKEEKTIYDGEWQEVITDTPPAGENTYIIMPYFEAENKKFYGTPVTLPSVFIPKADTGKSPQQNLPDITTRDWTME